MIQLKDGSVWKKGQEVYRYEFDFETGELTLFSEVPTLVTQEGVNYFSFSSLKNTLFSPTNYFKYDDEALRDCVLTADKWLQSKIEHHNSKLVKYTLIQRNLSKISD